jgi:hypothetical protein
MEIIKNTKLPNERAMSVARRWEKKRNLRLTPEEKEDLIKAIKNELQDAIIEERTNNDKFIALSEHENGVLNYYLAMIDQVKYMVGDIIMENSRKKRDLLLLEMAKIMGANVVEEEVPYKTKLKEAV